MYIGVRLSYLPKPIMVLQDLAPILENRTVAGRHRASPSATLDKRFCMHLVNLTIRLL